MKTYLNQSDVENLIQKGLSTKQIAESLGVTPRQITLFKNYRGMKSTRTSKLVLTDEEEQVVIGSLLGDGCMEINNKERGYCRLSISHCQEQEEYIMYKYKLLSRIANKPISKFREDKREKWKGGVKISLRTTTNEIFKEYRERWYPNNKRIVCHDDFLKIKSLGLAIWILDNGWNCKDSIAVSANSMNIEDALFVQQHLNTLGYQITIQKGLVFRFSVKSINKLIENIIQYIPESMMYKVRIKSRELLENLEIDNQQPSNIEIC